MSEQRPGGPRVADEVLSRLVRLEDHVSRAQRGVSLVTWSLVVVAVLEIAVIAGAVVLLYQSLASASLARETEAKTLSTDIADVARRLDAVETKLDSLPRARPASDPSLGQLREFLDSPGFRDLLRRQSTLTQENLDILEGHKPRENQQ
ncbi:MAG: hypothetical protein V2A58_00990 [Planctomycetota bacterium]